MAGSKGLHDNERGGVLVAYCCCEDGLRPRKERKVGAGEGVVSA